MDSRSVALAAARVGAFGCVAITAFWAFASDQGRHIRVLTEAEKASTVASDGNAPPTCFKLVKAPCQLFNSAGNLTPYGSCSFPNCTGATTNSCGTSYQTWECPADPNGNIGQCPSLPDGNTVMTCGNEQSGGTCVSVNGGCGVLGGTDNTPVKSCGLTHDQPERFDAPPCPPDL